MRQILMRGSVIWETGAISLINVEASLREDHPLREVKRMCKKVLTALEPDFVRRHAAKLRYAMRAVRENRNGLVGQFVGMHAIWFRWRNCRSWRQTCRFALQLRKPKDLAMHRCRENEANLAGKP